MRPWQPGDHLRIRRRSGYSHDAIFIGNGEVIHLWCEGFDKSLGKVRRDPLASVVRPRDANRVRRVKYGACDDTRQVLRRAFSQLGRGGYHLTQRNCQHFARWCKTGDARSDEVERVMAVTKGAAVNRIASKIALLAPAAAAAEGLSGGAGLMSGLSTIGGSAVAGVAIVAGVPGALAAAATCEALKDDPYLPADERDARRRGRQAAISGAAGGVGLSIALVHTAGIPGLSAVGITTGLKTLGLGTMLRGLAIVGGLPAVAALACGVFVYSRSRKRLSRG